MMQLVYLEYQPSRVVGQVKLREVRFR